MRTYRKIRISTKAQIRDFVNAASKCDFDVDVASEDRGHYIVDAKSVLGVLGLNFHAPLIVSYSGRNAAFEQFLQKTAVVA